MCAWMNRFIGYRFIVSTKVAHNNNVILNEEASPDLFQPLPVAPFLFDRVFRNRGRRKESLSFQQLNLGGQITFCPSVRPSIVSHWWAVVTGVDRWEPSISPSVCLCHFKMSFSQTDTSSQLWVACEISMGRKTNFRYIPARAFDKEEVESKVKARESHLFDKFPSICLPPIRKPCHKQRLFCLHLHPSLSRM